MKLGGRISSREGSYFFSAKLGQEDMMKDDGSTSKSYSHKHIWKKIIHIEYYQFFFSISSKSWNQTRDGAQLYITS